MIADEDDTAAQSVCDRIRRAYDLASVTFELDCLTILSLRDLCSDEIDEIDTTWRLKRRGGYGVVYYTGSQGYPHPKPFAHVVELDASKVAEGSFYVEIERAYAGTCYRTRLNHQARQWCVGQLNKRYQLEEADRRDRLKVRFENEIDAVNFKLRWQ